MKKSFLILLITISILNLTLINPIFSISHVSAIRYTNNTSLADVDASFIGENRGDLAGYPVAGAGDVNGDGFDDILISANLNDDGNINGGQIYLIFGKPSGWAMDLDLSNADASFIGTENREWAGMSIDGAGDVNGDGYDDILIGSQYNNTGGIDSGQAFLIFGKQSGWTMDTNLSDSDASFIGEYPQDGAGSSVAGAGDVNGDGYDDILVSARWNDESNANAGQVYLIFGKPNGWTMEYKLQNADASFHGEGFIDNAGYDVAGAGDVNNDNYDDILIGAYVNDEGDYNAGQVYLIFGRPSNWEMDSKLNDSNASFIGENAEDSAGISIAGAGDVNGDGFDDILIGANGSDANGNESGKAYIIFGKTTNWTMDTNLSDINTTFIGESPGDFLGYSVAGGGDVNSDGFDDILIGANLNDQVGLTAGKAYLILGKNTNWSMGINISNADASFIAEGEHNYVGEPVASAGDVNDDGFDDILIGAHDNSEGAEHAGQAYLVFPEINANPSSVNSIKVYSDVNYNTEISYGEINDQVYVELKGINGNSSRIDRAFVNITCPTSQDGICIWLLETELDTGIYHGDFKIFTRTYGRDRLLNASIGDIITITSVDDPTKNASLLVSTPIQLRPLQDKTIAIEDEEYLVNYWSFGYNAVNEWIFKTNASWLTWDATNHIVYGTPDNENIGTFSVTIEINDGLGHNDGHNFIINVQNTIPRILTNNVNKTFEVQPYHVDYNSDDEGLGNTFWHLKTNASWLELDPLSGELMGTPLNDNVGSYWVNISINDTNGGLNSTNFTLSVIDINDAPIIITEDVTTVLEDIEYSIDYDAIDIDDTMDLEWLLNTNASWLKLEKATGILSGIPTNFDVGTYYVNVSVIDRRLAMDYHNFTLDVLNVNDPPVWNNVPEYTEIPEGILFVFNVTASDVDLDDELIYSIKSDPVSNISINSKTGYIEWFTRIDESKMDGLFYYLNIDINVTDGKETIWTNFDLTVIPNPRPTVSLISPRNNKLSSGLRTELKWEGTDKQDELLTYDIYLSKDLTSVVNLLQSSCISRETRNTSFVLKDLVIGDTFYWTVIPFDGLSFGKCLSDVYTFIVNSPPLLSPIGQQKAHIGNKFQFNLLGTDPNTEDENNLRYKLELAPDGMKINTRTGELFWTPTNEQQGKHMVMVNLSDGKDFTNSVFEIEVTEKSSQNIFGSLGFISFIFIIILIFSFILFAILFIRRKKASKNQKIQHISALENQKRFAPKSTGPMVPLNFPDVPLGNMTIGYNSSNYNQSFGVQQRLPATPKQISPPISAITPTISPTMEPSPILATQMLQRGILPLSQPEMVGREAEINVLNTYLSKATSGQSSTVLVSGEAGIGKTKVIKEFIDIAKVQGFQVLLGNCMYESLTPLMPFLEALKSCDLDELFITESARIEAIFLVTPSGLLIEEVVRHETSLDSDIFSSVLTTVNNFISESLSTLLKEDKDGTPNILGYEEYRIIIESQKDVNLVVIISGKENELLINDMREMTQKITEDYGIILEHWDGDEQTVKGIKNIVNPLIASGKYDGIDGSDEDISVRKNRLYEKVTNGLVSQVNQKPVLLILEDLQWADPSSLALLHYISKTMKGHKIIIIGTFRTEEITPADGEAHPLKNTLELMTSEGLTERLELQRLQKDSVSEFLAAFLGKVDFSELFMNKFYSETDGNPLFMVELLKFLVEENIIMDDNGIWKEAKDIQDIEIPSKIYNVISRRLNRLDNENRKLLEYASVIGEIFTSPVLADALSVNKNELLKKLNLLETTHRLIRSINGDFKFDHAMIKEVLYNEVPEELRIEYHSIIANSIERLNENNLNAVLTDLAFHYHKCKNREKARKYLLLAAESAKKTYSFDEAIRFYSQALELETNEEQRRTIQNNLQSVLNLKENNGKS
jgi:hypothetical protein